MLYRNWSLRPPPVGCLASIGAGRCELPAPVRIRRGNLVRIAAEAHQACRALVVGQQVIVPKNLEHRPNELSLIVVTDLVAPHWLSSPIRS